MKHPHIRVRQRNNGGVNDGIRKSRRLQQFMSLKQIESMFLSIHLFIPRFMPPMNNISMQEEGNDH